MPVIDPVFKKRGISTDAHWFDISIGSLISILNPGECIQIKVAVFSVDLLHLLILDIVHWVAEISGLPLYEPTQA
jgi:hypothetical protein